MPDIKAELIAALLECPTIIEFERRDALIRQLPDNIRRNLKTTTAAQIDVIELVTWCMNYQDGLLRLIEQLRLFEGESLPMARVHAVWLRIQSPVPGTTQRAQLISQPVAALEPGVNLGEEIHWDRVEVASNFLRMIRDRSEYRVLAVQGPKAAGIGLFVDRLQKMCEETPNLPRPLLWARPTLGPDMGSPYSLAREILTSLHSRAAFHPHPIIASQADTLMAGLGQIDKREQGSSGGPRRRAALTDQEMYLVGFDLTRCLVEIARLCTVVLLIEQVHVLNPATRGWLLGQWLQKTVLQTEKGLAVMIAGESGLDGLSGRGVILYPALATLTLDDFVAWANQVLACDPMPPGDIARLHDAMKGNVEEFSRFLQYQQIIRCRP
jgi:hypothetical protein